MFSNKEMKTIGCYADTHLELQRQKEMMCKFLTYLYTVPGTRTDAQTPEVPHYRVLVGVNGSRYP